MALFPKLPAKKPGSNGGRRDALSSDPAPSRYRPAAGGGITITGFGLAEASPTRRVIEVSHGSSGMCAVLENAVLLYASAHASEARTLLAEGIENDAETQLLPLAWLALFDLHQRAGDRAAFEQLALSYVVRFERSGPTWNEHLPAPAAAPAPRAAVGGFVNVTGKLSAASATQFEALKRAVERNTSQARFDLGAISEFDDAGARLLADVLSDARRKQYPLRLQRPEQLRRLLDAAVKKGANGGEGAWLLSLELLQWHGDRGAFDDRAVDYAVTFEVSPPSWEPPALAGQTAPATANETAGTPAPESDADQGSQRPDVLGWSGVIAGSHPPQLAKLHEFADGRNVLPIDMSDVERVDFVGAGAIYNAVSAFEQLGKAVQIFGATPIIRAMLLLIGIAPGHFYKKPSV
jgi:anti-anti-sigma regulatory factor